MCDLHLPCMFLVTSASSESGHLSFFGSQVQKELRLQQEESSVALRAQQEEASSIQAALEEQLEACQLEIRELRDLRIQVDLEVQTSSHRWVVASQGQ
jgi:TolA-binding protein